MGNVVIGGTPPTGDTALPAYSGTVDGVNDLLPIYQNANAGTYSLNRNTLLNISSQPVGISDSQTLTSKTLTSPTISSPTLSGTIAGTYTIGGTPTFPSSVVTLTGTQILTNKTLTSPTINSPTISNATITTDTITGYTSSNTGSIYGISISSSQVTTNLTMTGTLTVSGALTASSGISIPTGSTLKVGSNPVWQYLGSVTNTAGATSVGSTPTLISSLTKSVTIPANATAVRITLNTIDLYAQTGAAVITLAIYSGATSGALTTQIAVSTPNVASGTGVGGNVVGIISSPSAGAVYYSGAISASASNGKIDSGTPAAILIIEVC